MNWTIRAIRNRLSHQVATEFRNAVQAHEPKSTVATAHHHLGFRGNDPKRTIGDLLTARPQARFVANFILRAVISFLNLMLNWISQLPTPLNSSFALTLSVAANHRGGAIVHITHPRFSSVLTDTQEMVELTSLAFTSTFLRRSYCPSPRVHPVDVFGRISLHYHLTYLPVLLGGLNVAFVRQN